MKLKVTFKDPDGVYECVTEEVRASLPKDMDEDEREELLEIRRQKVLDQLDKWIECNEYLTVEFDLKAGTATVVKE